MGSMLRAFRRRQGTTGRGFRRWGRQDRPGAFMRAWLALTDPARARDAFRPILAPLGGRFVDIMAAGPYMLSSSDDGRPVAPMRFGPPPTGSVPAAELEHGTPQPVVAPGKWRKRLAWVLKLVAWFKRRPEFPGYDAGGGPPGV